MSQLDFTFRSAESAIDALDQARARLVDDGIRVAIVLIQQHGQATSQDVFARMDADGLLSEGDKRLNARWLGAVWRSKRGRELFEPCGFRKTGNDSRNSHAAVRSVWRLRGTGDAE